MVWAICTKETYEGARFFQAIEQHLNWIIPSSSCCQDEHMDKEFVVIREQVLSISYSKIVST